MMKHSLRYHNIIVVLFLLNSLHQLQADSAGLELPDRQQNELSSLIRSHQLDSRHMQEVELLKKRHINEQGEGPVSQELAKDQSKQLHDLVYQQLDETEGLRLSQKQQLDELRRKHEQEQLKLKAEHAIEQAQVQVKHTDETVKLLDQQKTQKNKKRFGSKSKRSRDITEQNVLRLRHAATKARMRERQARQRQQLNESQDIELQHMQDGFQEQVEDSRNNVERSQPETKTSWRDRLSNLLEQVKRLFGQDKATMLIQEILPMSESSKRAKLLDQLDQEMKDHPGQVQRLIERIKAAHISGEADGVHAIVQKLEPYLPKGKDIQHSYKKGYFVVDKKLDAESVELPVSVDKGSYDPDEPHAI